MLQLITHRRSVTNVPPALSASTAPGVLVSSTSSVSVQPLSVRRPHRRRCETEPSDHTSLASRVKDEQSWAEIPEETKKLVRDKLSVIYDLQDISPEAMAYLEESLATRYKHLKNSFHTYFKRWDDWEIARLHVPIELQE
ncbi:hypothetical protein DVH24_006787 [Malus domestica]|uniref:Uncharacterized protein n=1 Tax=Malus domestica TaxID=3750 RepID=A0A498JAL5_MALDO|nr:hypothetical protein DVH24_006787 [Malus domestica]